MSRPRSHCPWEGRIPRLESSGNNAAQPTAGSGQDGRDAGAAPKEGDQRGWSSAWSTGRTLSLSLSLSFSLYVSPCLSLSLSCLSPISLSLSLPLHVRWRTEDAPLENQHTSPNRPSEELRGAGSWRASGLCVLSGQGRACRDLLGLALWARAWLRLGRPHSSASITDSSCSRGYRHTQHSKIKSEP